MGIICSTQHAQGSLPCLKQNSIPSLGRSIRRRQLSLGHPVLRIWQPPVTQKSQSKGHKAKVRPRPSVRGVIRRVFRAWRGVALARLKTPPPPPPTDRLTKEFALRDVCQASGGGGDGRAKKRAESGRGNERGARRRRRGRRRFIVRKNKSVSGGRARKEGNLEGLDVEEINCE